jgi:hypothetical protein
MLQLEAERNQFKPMAQQLVKISQQNKLRNFIEGHNLKI